MPLDHQKLPQKYLPEVSSFGNFDPSLKDASALKFYVFVGVKSLDFN